MNYKNLLAVGGVLLAVAPAMAQNTAIVQTNNGDAVTTVTKSKRKTVIHSNDPVTGDRQTTVITRRRHEPQTTVTTEQHGQQIIVTVNKEPVTFAETSRPVMMGGRVMVPLRGVTERLGGNVLYDEETKVITGAQPSSGNQFRLRVGSEEALLNGNQMPLDTPPQVVNGTTYVPLRFVSEALGAKVSWAPEQRSVIITVNGNQTTVSQATP